MTDPQTFPEALDAERDSKGGADPGTHAQTEQAERAAQTTTPPQAVRGPSPWPARGAAVARATQRALARPRVQLTALGSVLLLLAAFFVTGSAWTAPLAVAGILALAVAWLGSRLDGRLMLEWGESGVTFELKTDINVPERPRQRVESLAIPRRLDAVSADALVVESTGATVEIDIAELKALIALAEAA
jgi:hypothetical protein